MRKKKKLFLILYSILLTYLIYRAFHAWQTSHLETYIAIIGFLVVPVLTRIFDWIFHENQELEQERKEKRRMHQKELINTVIKPFYNHNTVSLTNEPLAMEHLRKGYPKIRKLWFKQIEDLKIQISENKNRIREYIKNKSIEGTPLFSKLNDIYDEGYMSQNEFGDIITYTNGDEIYKLVVDFIRTGKLTKDGEYNEFVEAIINDKHLLKLFENLYGNKKQLDADVYEFEQHLSKIVRDFEKWGVELKGTCKECKPTYGILKF